MLLMKVVFKRKIDFKRNISWYGIAIGQYLPFLSETSISHISAKS